MTTQTPTLDQIRAAWDAIAPRFDQFTSPAWGLAFADEVLRKVDIQPGTRFLDIACGSGALAIPAARQGADVLAVDIAPVMIERLTARAQSEGLSTIEGRVMNGESLELPDDTFDVVASQNGVSLFPDLQGGLREAVRVTRPGGQVLIVGFGAPQKAEFLGFFMRALQTSVPGFTPLSMDPPPLPFQVADPDRLRQELGRAGLADVDVDSITFDTTFGSARQFWDIVTSGNPIVVQLTANLTDQQRDDTLQALDGMLRERASGEREAVLHVDMNVGVGTK